MLHISLTYFTLWSRQHHTSDIIHIYSLYISICILLCTQLNTLHVYWNLYVLYGHPGLAHPLIRYLQSSRLYTFVSFIYYISIIMYTLFYTYIYTHIVPSLSIVVFFTVCYADTHACYIYSIYMYNHHYYSIQLFKYILCVYVSVLYTISLFYLTHTYSCTIYICYPYICIHTVHSVSSVYHRC